MTSLLAVKGCAEGLKFTEDSAGAGNISSLLQQHFREWGTGSAKRWVKSQEDDCLKRTSRPNAAQHRPCIKPGEEWVPPPLLQPRRGEFQSDYFEVEGPTVKQTSPVARPLSEMSPRKSPTGEPTVFELMNNTSQKEGQTSLLVLGAGRGAESSVQDEPIRECGGDNDEFSYLDARARTLLEHCRRLLAPSSTPSDQVSTGASADLEENARTLLTEYMYKRPSDRPSTPQAHQSNILPFLRVATASIGEGGCFGESGNTAPCQQENGRQSGSVRVDNVCLAPSMENCSALMISLLHDTYQAGDESNRHRAFLGSVLARSGAEERTEWLRNDTVLSVLLRRGCEIEAEIERRHSAKLK